LNKEENTMNSKLRKAVSTRTFSTAVGIALACFLINVICAAPQASQKPAKQKTASSTSQKPARQKAPAQKTFDTPQEAADAAIQAAESNDQKALLEIFGPDALDIISSGDQVEDQRARTRVIELAREKKVVEKDPFDVYQATLTLGNDDWPFPIPIVKRNGKWLFDTKEGRIEVLARRIGDNELAAIQVCRGFVEAQIEYATEDRDGDGMLEYAQRIISAPGQRDGLAWRNTNGDWEGPVGEAVARAVAAGYKSKTEPFHGYRFRVLMGQGPEAPTGALNYVVKGSMIGGFALIAWPDRYWVSGVQTFIVSNDGVVYQKDLGPQTAKIVAGIKTFNPDPGWLPVLDEE
jgi:hypothetical protein